MQISISKKTRRQLKKGAKAVRKAIKRARKPAGLAAGALTLGGIAAAVVMDPTVRQRSRALFDGTVDYFRRGTSESSPANGALHEHTQH